VTSLQVEEALAQMAQGAPHFVEFSGERMSQLMGEEYDEHLMIPMIMDCSIILMCVTLWLCQNSY
jgi:hypothetical protein